MILILGGALLSATGIFLSTLRQNEEKIISANARLEFEKDLREKNNEIANLNKQIAATVTGGDSYCHLMVTSPGLKSKVADLLLMHEGKYPVYDVSIKIDDVDYMMQLLHAGQESGQIPADSISQSMRALSAASKIIQVGNVGVGQAIMPIASLDMPETDSKSYNVTINARNGSVFHVVRFRRVDGKWKMAIRVSNNGKVIKESADPEFPRKANGDIEWDKPVKE